MRTALVEEHPFTYAAALTCDLPRHRFDAALPSTVAEGRRVYSASHPPRAYVVARLRDGDASMMKRFETALRAALAEQPQPYEVEAVYGRPLALAAEDARVSELVVWLLRDESIPRDARAAIVTALARRPLSARRADLEATFASDRVSDEHAVRFFGAFASFHDEVPLERMHALAVRYWDVDEDFCLCAIEAIGHSDESSVIELLRDLASRAEDGDPRRERAESIRSARAESNDIARSPLAWHPDESAIVRDANRAVREIEGGARHLLAVRPDALVEVVMALECAITDETAPLYVRLGGVRQLADLDREHAVELAHRIDDDALRAVLEPLRRFPSAEALAQHLASLGLVDASCAVESADGVTDLLARAGRLESFNTETDVYPNGHDGVLDALSRLASPDLGSVLFEEVPHADEHETNDAEQLPDRYRLRAFTAERMYEVIAGDTSDWLDVPAMLGLLNTLCRDLGSEIRYVTIPTGSQDAEVLAAPESAIRAAIEDGILVVASPSDAATAGREHEDAVVGRDR